MFSRGRLHEMCWEMAVGCFRHHAFLAALDCRPSSRGQLFVSGIRASRRHKLARRPTRIHARCPLGDHLSIEASMPASTEPRWRVRTTRRDSSHGMANSVSFPSRHCGPCFRHLRGLAFPDAMFNSCSHNGHIGLMSYLPQVLRTKRHTHAF